MSIVVMESCCYVCYCVIQYGYSRLPICFCLSHSLCIVRMYNMHPIPPYYISSFFYLVNLTIDMIHFSLLSPINFPIALTTLPPSFCSPQQFHLNISVCLLLYLCFVFMFYFGLDRHINIYNPTFINNSLKNIIMKQFILLQSFVIVIVSKC